ncbi:hypothetical protein F0562_030287 [Nyssa sinensis]|uniref:G-patch domain-containing protein n=1 Tax=Nyssa sinensis TaxID=561372 RepID=A0A5J5AXZ4_9ASTE|nr:hypothetical protein F0562_030287 [Nyssa sinensis]
MVEFYPIGRWKLLLPKVFVYLCTLRTCLIAYPIFLFFSLFVGFSGRNPRKEGANLKSVSRSGNSDGKKASGSKKESQKPRVNAFGYVYPVLDSQEVSLPNGGNSGDNNLDESHPIVLVDSKETQIVAYVDQTPSAEPQNLEFTYDYGMSYALDDSSHRGLGFCDEAEVTPSGVRSSVKMEGKEGSSFESSSPGEDMDADGSYIHGVSTKMVDDLLAEASSPEENPGFLSIGGMKLYTQDISDEEGSEDDGEELLGEESLESAGPGDSAGSSDSDGSEDTSDSDSDIDDEVAEDYLEGIGGIDKVIDVKRLLEQVIDVPDDDISDGRFNETLGKLGGISLQDASREYGKKPRSGRKHPKEACQKRAATYAWSSALDDLMLVKDPRTVYAKKKHVSQFPQSWPTQNGKNFRKFPGEKKKHRKELIAVKRRERMIRRGVDLEQINLKLQQIVLDGLDMFSFQPMHSRDCSQVRRLAAIYRLWNGCQGSGKKRFVTVMRTEHTSMPSSSDKLRLEKLIGAGDEDADFTVNDIKSAKGDRNSGKKFAMGNGFSPQELLQSATSKSLKKSVNNQSSGEGSKKKMSGKTGSYAAQPVSFVSSGIMQLDTIENTTIESKETNNTFPENKDVASSSKYGAFELHTTGFGSMMMAKMGYIEGGGLGKDGQGMTEPIEVIQRPKSLGLGAEASESSGKLAKNEPKKYAAEASEEEW